MKEENCTEQYKGIIILRKGKISDEDIWYATVGKQLVSDGGFKTKKELINNLEDLNLERVCKIIAGVFGRVVELAKIKEQ